VGFLLLDNEGIENDMNPTLIKYWTRHVCKLVTSLDYGHGMMDDYSQTYHKSRFYQMVRMGIQAHRKTYGAVSQYAVRRTKNTANLGAHSQNYSM
jgi:hypothetical protein